MRMQPEREAPGRICSISDNKLSISEILFRNVVFKRFCAFVPNFRYNMDQAEQRQQHEGNLFL